MSLVINALGGGHTDTHTNTQTIMISRNQAHVVIRKQSDQQIDSLSVEIKLWQKVYLHVANFHVRFSLHMWATNVPFMLHWFVPYIYMYIHVCTYVHH